MTAVTELFTSIQRDSCVGECQIRPATAVRKATAAYDGSVGGTDGGRGETVTVDSK